MKNQLIESTALMFLVAVILLVLSYYEPDRSKNIGQICTAVGIFTVVISNIIILIKSRNEKR